MKPYITNSFGDWVKVNEGFFNSDNTPDRAKQTSGSTNRVVAIPIDKSSFKIKIIRDMDVLDDSGNLTSTGWTAILAWIKNQKNIISYYSGLNDMVNNFVTYSVGKDNARKQLITFTVMPRTAADKLPKDIQFINAGIINNYITDPTAAKSLLDANKKAADTQAGKEQTLLDDKSKTEVKPEASIVIPNGALKMSDVGLKPNEVVKKVQELIITKVGKALANSKVKPQYDAFMKYGADGKYGKNTKNIVKAIKQGFKMSEIDGTVITQEVVNNLSKLA
jgi:hypothetical protein